MQRNRGSPRPRSSLILSRWVPGWRKRQAGACGPLSERSSHKGTERRCQLSQREGAARLGKRPKTSPAHLLL
ncbi:hypothetical protein NDU88_001365 [Pleurodeles waltl]|uniref:Uncharacterized protein n=1 Tax=Pleurodeles waltl TaxID=8319 RepID=A0AAV7UVW9_PLEWA|nr:hypothetical protein NDU88_001365 [Pleurodeles waltl]